MIVIVYVPILLGADDLATGAKAGEYFGILIVVIIVVIIIVTYIVSETQKVNIRKVDKSRKPRADGALCKGVKRFWIKDNV